MSTENTDHRAGKQTVEIAKEPLDVDGALTFLRQPHLPWKAAALPAES